MMINLFDKLCFFVLGICLLYFKIKITLVLRCTYLPNIRTCTQETRDRRSPCKHVSYSFVKLLYSLLGTPERRQKKITHQP